MIRAASEERYQVVSTRIFFAPFVGLCGCFHSCWRVYVVEPVDCFMCGETVIQCGMCSATWTDQWPE